MRGVVSLVTVMTLLLVAGMCLLFYGLATKGSSGPAQQELSLPRGAVIDGMTGYDNGVILHTSGGAGGEKIFFYNAKKARIEKEIRIKK